LGSQNVYRVKTYRYKTDSIYEIESKISMIYIKIDTGAVVYLIKMLKP
jgi:hypothetical protein